MCGHPREAIKVSVIGAGRLRRCKNTGFVWDLSKGGFVRVAVSKAVPLRECSFGELALYNIIQVADVLNLPFRSSFHNFSLPTS